MKAVQFLNKQTTPLKYTIPKKAVFKPQKTLNELSIQDKKKVDFWLAYCNVAVTLLDTATKALLKLGIFHSRNAIFDLIAEFKKLNGYYKGNEEYKKEEIEVDNHLFLYLELTPNERKRVDGIINKIYKERK